MAERGIFGVSLWESLSPDLKRRAAIDLATADMESGETENSGRSFRTTRAGAKRAARGPSRHRVFAKRDRTTTGILASGAEDPASFSSCTLVLGLDILRQQP